MATSSASSLAAVANKASASSASSASPTSPGCSIFTGHLWTDFKSTEAPINEWCGYNHMGSAVQPELRSPVAASTSQYQ
ncbi:hypothetical protein Pdw03_7906 [Penicillium digitatum]|uniref:Uncharacterized protein n=1 Tax=Penicillium digitatum TaxID=36651 RepID=A0A7T6XMY3_PENDI|nr:hypothetical protein Pdw03_7906 [Penicillium digitatum]